MTAADEHPPHRPDDEDQGTDEGSSDEQGARPQGEPGGDRPAYGGDTGAEGEGSADKLPAEPSEDDDTPLGDTDQHSVSDA